MMKPDSFSSFQFRGNLHNNTSTTFLARLQGRESVAWKDFMEIYAPLIKYWCRRRKNDLLGEERRDILQEVLQKVSLSIDQFDYTRQDRSFRGWLRRITENQIRDHLRQKAKNVNISRLYSDPDHLNIPIPCPTIPELDDPVDPEEEASEQRVLLRQVLKRIRPEFREKSWDVFHLLFDADKDSSEVAEMMNMKADAVRQIRSRILKRIREEFSKLGIETDPPFDVASMGR